MLPELREIEHELPIIEAPVFELDLNKINFCGVYFLTSWGKIVYVGQSTNIIARVQNHIKESKGYSPDKKVFNGAHFIIVDSSELDKVEDYYIRLFKPKFNKTHNAKTKVVSLERSPV